MEAALALALALAEAKPAPTPERQHYCVREEVARRLSRPWTGDAPQRRRERTDTIRPLAELPPAAMQKAVDCRTHQGRVVPVAGTTPLTR